MAGRRQAPRSARECREDAARLMAEAGGTTVAELPVGAVEAAVAAIAREEASR